MVKERELVVFLAKARAGEDLARYIFNRNQNLKGSLRLIYSTHAPINWGIFLQEPLSCART